jgi:hypothetical protein
VSLAHIEPIELDSLSGPNEEKIENHVCFLCSPVKIGVLDRPTTLSLPAPRESWVSARLVLPRSPHSPHAWVTGGSVSEGVGGFGVG